MTAPAKVVHYLYAGFPLCGFVMGPPVLWPDGHSWLVAPSNAPAPPGATCARCIEEAKAPRVLPGGRP